MAVMGRLEREGEGVKTNKEEGLQSEIEKVSTCICITWIAR